MTYFVYWVHIYHELKKIGFSGCQEFTEVGLKNIITHCSKLVYIDVSYTGNYVAYCYPQIQQCLPHLKVLVVGPNPFQEVVQKFLGKLRRSMPLIYDIIHTAV